MYKIKNFSWISSNLSLTICNKHWHPFWILRQDLFFVYEVAFWFNIFLQYRFCFIFQPLTTVPSTSSSVWMASVCHLRLCATTGTTVGITVMSKTVVTYISKEVATNVQSASWLPLNIFALQNIQPAVVASSLVPVAAAFLRTGCVTSSTTVETSVTKVDVVRVMWTSILSCYHPT